MAIDNTDYRDKLFSRNLRNLQDFLHNSQNLSAMKICYRVAVDVTMDYNGERLKLWYGQPCARCKVIVLKLLQMVHLNNSPKQFPGSASIASIIFNWK